jgi:hypothetical protein
MILDFFILATRFAPICDCLHGTNREGFDTNSTLYNAAIFQHFPSISFRVKFNN